MSQRPPLPLRIVMLALLFGLAALDHNPLVRLEAWLGLSPSPLERWFGVRGFFSGMTEAAHRLTRFDLVGAARSNLFVYPTCVALAFVVLSWKAPSLQSRRQELSFLVAIAAGSLLNNFLPGLLGA